LLHGGAGWRTLRRVSETPDSPASDGPRDAEDPRAWLGALLDARYELTDYIGSGSIGHVYRARDHRLEFREVAIKILKPGLREDQVARFKREALLTGGLSSPHLVPVTDFSTTPDARDYIVMELLRGEPLNARLDRDKCLPVGTALRLADQMLAGLEAAHKAGVVHRDLKPENIFVVEEPGIRDHVKIVDFGFARVFPKGNEALDVTGEAQIVIGTVSYMSPEQLRGKPVDHRADLFSVGAILFKMLTGWLPYETSPSGTAMMLAARFRAVNLDHPPKSLGEAAPALADEHMLDAVLRRALQVDPAARFASAGEMRRALANAIGKATMPPEPSEPGVGVDVWARPKGREVRTSQVALAPMPELPGAVGDEHAAPSPASPTPPARAVERPAPPAHGALQVAILVALVALIAITAFLVLRG
jgi:serine/threonine protein kinase